MVMCWVWTGAGGDKNASSKARIEARRISLAQQHISRVLAVLSQHRAGEVNWRCEEDTSRESKRDEDSLAMQRGLAILGLTQADLEAALPTPALETSRLQYRFRLNP